jgi:TetR/AcrR family transcriptional repressor of nem operon
MLKGMTRTKAPAATRRRILEAAFEEFYRNGFQGGSLNRIVEGAGTTKGALFHHFSGKSELGYAVVEEVIEPSIRAHWMEPLDRSGDPVGDLQQIIRKTAKAKMTGGRLEQGCPLNNLAQEMSPLDEEFRKRIEKVYSAWRECVAGAFSRGIAAGTVRRDVSPGNAAAFFVAALAGIIGTAKNSQDPGLLRQAGAGLIEYLEGLRP